MNGYKRFSILILLPSFLLLGLAFRHPLAAEERILVFGRVYDDPVRSIQDRQEFVDYIAKKLAPLGIAGGRILVLDKMHLLAQPLERAKWISSMTASCQRWCSQSGQALSLF